MIVKRIEPSEDEDFKSAIRQAGYSESDFEIVETEDDYPSGAIVPITGSVTVTFVKTGVKRTYDSGHGTAWVVAFEKDLRAGLFTER